jgi:hypothetical protein
MGSLTPNLKLTLPTIGGDTGPLFAQEINGDMAIIDLIYGGVNALSIAGNANVTATESQAQNLVQQLTGVLTGNVTYFLPAVGAFYAVENATTGPFTLSVGCLGGGNVQVIPQGLSTWIWTDGTFTRLSNPPGWQEIATYIISGAATQTILLPAPFRRFKITFQGVVFTASGASLNMLASLNGGSSFITAYIYATFVNRSDGSTLPGGSSSVTSVPITGAGAVTTNPWDGTYDIWPGSATQTFIARGEAFGVNATPVWTHTHTACSSSTVGVINALRLLPNAGNFSGTVLVEGLP